MTVLVVRSFVRVLVGSLLVLPVPAQAPGEEIPLPLRVNHAIALGVDNLKARQRPDGSFREGPQHAGGATALVAFTLVKSGVRKQDPALRKALAALADVRFQSTYSAAVHLLLCEALREPDLTRKAQGSLDFLIDNQDEATGVWAYPWGSVDSSNTQFALLGLRAGARLGLAVPEASLVAVAQGLEAFDHPKGGFTYGPEQNQSYAGITAAGLAGFAVLEEFAREHSRLRSVLERRAGVRESAEAWMETRFDAMRNVHQDGTWRNFMQFAYLWAVERWCGLTGRERIGEHDWYAEGAEWLVSVQTRNGSFGPAQSLEDTCFALLFLRRATVSGGGEAELERLRAERPERPTRPGVDARRLIDWWLAGPWPQGGEGPILLHPPFTPEEVEPRANGKIARREWLPVTLRGDQWADLELVDDKVGDRLLWLVATGLTVTGEAPLEALLWLELGEGWDVWLDGERLSRERRRANTVQADFAVPLRLAPGEHRLAILVEDREGPSAFGALLTSSTNGPPPEGLQVERHERVKVR